jgi:hypothetical protein
MRNPCSAFRNLSRSFQALECLGTRGPVRTVGLPEARIRSGTKRPRFSCLVPISLPCYRPKKAAKNSPNEGHGFSFSRALRPETLSAAVKVRLWPNRAQLASSRQQRLKPRRENPSETQSVTGSAAKSDQAADVWAGRLRAAKSASTALGCFKRSLTLHRKCGRSALNTERTGNFFDFSARFCGTGECDLD